ncbi:MAG: LuxR family transcriptional regulator [Rhodospirillales bacterium]|nr:LuxR family transcriptional regulator [Rhodospirillales bacterium]
MDPQTRTFEFISEVEAANEAGAVRSRFQKFIEGFGLSNAACVKIPSPGESLLDLVLMNTRPDDWSSHYNEGNYISRDPMVQEMFGTYLPYSWSDVLDRREIDKTDIRIVKDASSFGMNEGFVIPLFGHNGYSGLVSVAGENVELPPAVRSALQLSSIYVHNRLRSLQLAEYDEIPELTGREIECLRWVMAGKSDWDIGQILFISEKTVNYHVEKIKRKYAVATRTQAVVYGLRAGVLTL